MTRTILGLTTAVLLAVTTSAIAQETNSDQTEAEATTTEEAATGTTETEAAASEAAQAEGDTATETDAEGNPVDSAFPVAGDEAAEPQIGDQYIREVHGDWEVRCIKGEQADECNLYQLLKDEAGTAVAEFNVVNLPKGGQAVTGVTFVTPLGTLLTAKVALRVDSGKTTRYDFNWCEVAGCVARFGLTQGELNALRRGVAATVTIASVQAPDQPISLKLSLNGITAAYKAMVEGPSEPTEPVAEESSE